MLFEKALEDIKELVNRELAIFFQRKRLKAAKLDIKSAEITDQVADFTLRGGKRTRAFLVWLGSQTVISDKSQVTSQNKKPEDALLKVMLAVEVFQTFALIHDDILDEDSERRGGPTIHEYFKLTTSAAQHFGVSMAILAGDLAFAWASELINKVKNPKVQELFSVMSEETILGQTLDVLKAQAGEKIDKKKIDELKTGYYTVVRPLQLGALLAGADAKLIKQFETYGLAVGNAFQLRDDYLDKEIKIGEFTRKSEAYFSKIPTLINSLDVNINTRQLFAEFAQFVVTRAK